ncbi:type II toxin-antitoxin system VapC family toxin [uncultured Sphingomonas sp.]|uniref:type II toxin-antitoxin system VapC family toxin n=1 Tax=uncultured Sphingomonas sp. TaxID=158754 RepID=UPI0035CC6869
MSLFVDASALTAIIGDEPERQALETALDADQARLISGLAMWETARAVSRGRSIESGLFEVERYCAILGISVVPIGPREAAAAVQAHARYRKGTGHPARLNMGDCFAYACARTNNARLLYKGDDFVHTDLR